MRWAEITIKTTEEASEAICEMLAQVGADGIASQDPQEFRNTIDNDPLSYCDDGTIESYRLILPRRTTVSSAWAQRAKSSLIPTE